MTAKVVLFSRDDRTFKLFRKSWVTALVDSSIKFEVKNRGFGFINLVNGILNFIISNKKSRFIFGTSEICLYSFFSNQYDVFIFTGIGRLLQRNGKIQSAVIFFLKLTYKNQKIIALNSQDRDFLQNIFSTNVLLINGEGFYFDNKNLYCRRINDLIRIAYVGRMLKSKGVDRLVEAFIEIAHLNCELHLLGDFDFHNSDGVSRDWLLSAQNKAPGKIYIHGFIENPRDFLLNIDVLVSLSEREGLPFSVLEALEAGCYALLTLVPGHLSFSQLKGVGYTSREDIENDLRKLISGATQYLNFDSQERLKICIKDFGAQKVISDIKTQLLSVM